MKTLGRSQEDGGYIVSMTVDEYQAFRDLEQSITGSGYLNTGSMGLRGVNLAPVFRALSDLASARHSITEVQCYINNLANYFGSIRVNASDDDK